MRLDHLLSKEHLVSAGRPLGVVGGWSRRLFRTERVRRVAHGWNIDSAVGSDASDLSTLCLQGWDGSGVELLAGARCWVLRDQASYCYVSGGGGWAYGSFVGPGRTYCCGGGVLVPIVC